VVTGAPESIAAEHAQGGVDERLLTGIFDEVKKELAGRPSIPSATYRLQFNRFFTFRQAREQVDYLHRLGISHIYASPYFRARADSLHGYDIANHNELNPYIGAERDLKALVRALRERGMGHILDTVPNHMGIGEEGNVWWLDVLENGRSSIYAPYFDIDWAPINTKLTDKVLLPLLGDQYGRVLENGELRLAFQPGEGTFTIHYYDRTFPVEPRSCGMVLGHNIDALTEELGPESEAALEYQSILTALSYLPQHSDTPPERIAERNREKEVIKRRTTALCEAEPRVTEYIQRLVEAFNGTPGDPRSFDLLDALLEVQPYRLSSWRVAGEEINYRRFFDVNELAAVQVDKPEVFAETHRLILRLLREGKLDGLRIDHVDGLRDPAGYFHALQRGYFLEMCRARIDSHRDTRKLDQPEREALEAALLERFEHEREAGRSSTLYCPLFVVVEKILARGEELPPDWPVYGTTGYEFTNAVNGLFVDGDNARAFTEIYHAFIDDDLKFSDLAYQSKKEIMRLSLSSEVNTLTNMLSRISERDRHYRDFTMNAARQAIREVIACFPVYRTYITTGLDQPDRRDRAHIETALARAKKRNPATDPSIFDFLGDVLLLRGYDALSDEQREARFNFVMKFQQVTGPVVAKGLEDTAFYVYNRLVSLNEVGGEPEYFGLAPAQFHRQQAARQHQWPYQLLTTSTHDTKRSEDVRARIDVLSEMPKEWRAAVRRWARMNRKHKRNVDGAPAPSLNEEYFIYQTLVGVWPFKQELDDIEHDALTERMMAYMRKALNEAKVNTSWVNTNEEYQSAVSGFLVAILRRGEDNRFLADFLPFQAKVAHYGAFNSLSQALLKITSPGVPDIYQGTELWDLSLVDPDNRRPVDYELRRKLLDRVERVKGPKTAAALLDSKEDGRIKLHVTARALNFRRENHALFVQGSYTPIEVEGNDAANIVAFARAHEGAAAVVVAPRLLTRLATGGNLLRPVGGVWAGSRLPVPLAAPGDRLRNVFTGEELAVEASGGGPSLPLERVLGSFPVALLHKV
jgi:(1->4)-alpha-D-glucan 1-alpha-D-glucosylmutase